MDQADVTTKGHGSMVSVRRAPPVLRLVEVYSIPPNALLPVFPYFHTM
ncbi:protein of unknown function [Streptomyces sp. KY75]|nr:protein of unknown function [Streptomyces sp. KY75]CAD5975332.1 protein of unknown function [Streptomyces sp. KY70]